MSVCIIITEPQGAFCHRHHCFLTQVDELCSVARMASEVEHLTAELVDRDRRIEKALDRIQDAINTVIQQAQGVREFGGSLDWARGAESAAEIVQDALRGESDE